MTRRSPSLASLPREHTASLPREQAVTQGAVEAHEHRVELVGQIDRGRTLQRRHEPDVFEHVDLLAGLVERLPHGVEPVVLHLQRAQLGGG